MRLRTLVLASIAAAAFSGPVRTDDTKRTDDIHTAVKKGIQYLLNTQAKEGYWLEVNHDMSVSNMGEFKGVACTSLAIWALSEFPDVEPEKSKAAIQKGLEYVLGMIDKVEWKKPSSWQQQVVRWGQSYGILVMSRFYKENKRDDLKKAMAKLVEGIKQTQQKNGAWAYFGNQTASFLTSVTLQALRAAKECGVEVPDEVIQNGVKGLKKSRGSEGFFGYYASGKVSKTAGDIGDAVTRTPLGEYTLFLFGESSPEKLKRAVGLFFKYRERLEQIRTTKDDPKKIHHYKPHNVAHYYFLFGHYYASRALEHLDAADREKHAAKIREVLLDIQSGEGSWVDSVNHAGPQYGTAIALMTLAGIQKTSAPSQEK